MYMPPPARLRVLYVMNLGSSVHAWPGKGIKRKRTLIHQLTLNFYHRIKHTDRDNHRQTT